MISSSPAAADLVAGGSVVIQPLPALPKLSRAAFLLDFDGTLADIAPAPDQVVVAPSLIQDLKALRAHCGDAVAIVSGRPMAQIETLLGDAPYALAGEHGTEFRHAPGGPVEPLPIAPVPPAWLQAARDLAAGTPGVLLEGKRLGFVLHYRAAPASGEALLSALRKLVADPAEPGLAAQYIVVAAKMAWEVRPAGVDKATAVQALMARPPFDGRTPIYVGDDVTDEDGMRAARALGGLGLHVDQYFGGPAAVRAWLASLARGEGA